MKLNPKQCFFLPVEVYFFLLISSLNREGAFCLPEQLLPAYACS